MLLAAAFRTLSDHLDRNDPVLILGIVPGHGVQHLSIRAAEGKANDAARCWDQAQILAVRSDHLYPGIGAHVQASCGVERAPIVISAALQLGELMLVGERAIL